ncbi:hypothetical protein DPMN_029053 [Dreissena polymorpha]|uniref:Uncharacterized protein n=1 Tax=Dreissena polymorpha TaxID=45954 RepID=A0A9D4DD57_DREPO|nr:hypothetical protein DPMN_084172 [Dreissena polymorpha]KAH3741588.1 hypothetical protein DPMN_048313 [Dreissena polymorpha]KAH3866003.1 hypothetical protein DPMN_029053 [Dreissena polymorpha]
MFDTNKSESQDWEEFDSESNSERSESDSERSESNSERSESHSERVSPQPGQFTQDRAAKAEKLKLPHQSTARSCRL